MNCEDLFKIRKDIGMRLLLMKTSDTFSKVPFQEIKNMIAFDDTQHIGTIVPVYYISGQPSSKWICNRCKKLLN